MLATGPSESKEPEKKDQIYNTTKTKKSPTQFSLLK